MLEQIKIIFIDLDGTLLNNKSEITEYTRKVIQNAMQKGIYIILCSGRASKDMIDKSKFVNAYPIVISDNGALVYNYETNTNIYQDKIKLKELIEIWDFAEKNNINIVYNSQLKRLKSKNAKKEGTIIHNASEIEDNITQIVVDTNNYDGIKKLKELIKTKYTNLENKNLWEFTDINSNELYFEMDISNKFNNKGKAINKVLEYLNIKKENVACFGDQINDFSMFESCGIKISMSNAVYELKQKADFTTEYSNDEDGVAKFIEKYILRR